MGGRLPSDPPFLQLIIHILGASSRDLFPGVVTSFMVSSGVPTSLLPE